MRVPECPARRPLPDRQDAFLCVHPSMHVVDGVVFASTCKACHLRLLPPPAEFRQAAAPPRRDVPCWHLGAHIKMRDCASCRGNVRLKVFQCRHPRHVETTLGECANCGDYQRSLQDSPPSRWAVGVTTAPRARPTFERSLASLRSAGWNEIHVFAEPDSNLGEREGLIVTQRDRVLGAWPNWLLGLAELVLRVPDADAFLMVQDDAVFCRNARAYMEATLWPSAAAAIVSPYCPLPYAGRSTGWRCAAPASELCGAVALAFPAVAARALLASPGNWATRSDPTALQAGIDVHLGAWAATLGVEVHYHFPSLVEHVGETSTLWPGVSNEGRRATAEFVAADDDALALLRPPDETDIRPQNVAPLNESNV